MLNLASPAIPILLPSTKYIYIYITKYIPASEYIYIYMYKYIPASETSFGLESTPCMNCNVPEYSIYKSIQFLSPYPQMYLAI